jgi:hypothetical protein
VIKALDTEIAQSRAKAPAGSVPVVKSAATIAAEGALKTATAALRTAEGDLKKAETNLLAAEKTLAAKKATVSLDQQVQEALKDAEARLAAEDTGKTGVTPAKTEESKPAEPKSLPRR